jgi:NTP pyrophosphatase (non-canonical NTP hydrolase)
MNLNDYQEAAARTHGHKDTPNNALACHGLGITEEAGEVAGLLAESFPPGKTEREREKLASELGDVLWYISALASKIHVPLSVVVDTVIVPNEEPPPHKILVYRLVRDAGAVAGLVKKHLFHGHPLVEDMFVVALGKVYGSLVALVHHHWLHVDEIMNANLAKLARRYPEGFTTEQSITRPDTLPAPAEPPSATCLACQSCGLDDGDFVCGHKDAGTWGQSVNHAASPKGHCGPLRPKFVQHRGRMPDGSLKP